MSEAETVTELRDRLRKIRQDARREMERKVARKSAPVLAELAELTAISRMLGRRKITLRDARTA